MDVQWTGVVSECSNPVLCWAKVSLLGIGVESVSTLQLRCTMCRGGLL